MTARAFAPEVAVFGEVFSEDGGVIMRPPFFLTVLPYY